MATGFLRVGNYPIVSSDAVYRQTFGKEQLWREKGAVGVDKDAIRNINASMRTINPWSWDAALKYALGEDANEQTLWALYKADKTNYQKR